MKKIATGLTTVVGLMAALPVFAQLGTTVNRGLAYATIVGWGTQDLRTTIMLIINILMGFLGIIAVLIVLYGGFKWMTAGGNEEKVEGAKKLITRAVIGLAIIFVSYSITQYVFNAATGAATDSDRYRRGYTF